MSFKSLGLVRLCCPDEDPLLRFPIEMMCAIHDSVLSTLFGDARKVNGTDTTYRVAAVVVIDTTQRWSLADENLLIALMPCDAEVGVIATIQGVPDLPGGRRP